MINPLKNLVGSIKTGSREEVKAAQKQVEKFWHHFYIPKRKEGREAFMIFLDEIKKADEIQDLDHLAYFIHTLKWPLLSIGEEYFVDWAEFIFTYIQHPSGKIRQAVLHAADYLIYDIAADLQFDGNDHHEISQSDRLRIQKNRERFGNFVSTVEELLGQYDEPRYHRYKYIHSIPSGVYKSLQKLMVEHLLRSDFYKDVYADFLREQGLSQTTPEALPL